MQVNEVNAREGEKHLRRGHLRYAIETGELPVGPHLITECQSSKLNRLGKFVGLDDVLSAVSWAREWRSANPYVEPEIPLDPRTHFDMRRVTKRQPLRL